MRVDRNIRAQLGAKLRTDRRLSHAEARAAQAILFAGTDCRTGRCQMFRERIAREAAVSLRSVDRAIARLKELAYLVVTPTWGQRHRQQGGRWFRPRGANVFTWAANFLVATVAAHPSQNNKQQAPAALSEGLSRVLERLGHAIADRRSTTGAPERPQ
ncbi:MAG: hypothetical protein WCJ64_12055 [Rhodospirillaceae bacterium]